MMNEPIPKLRTVDGAAPMSQPLRPPNFVVDTLLSRGLHILAGSPKVGKSWLALWLAVTVAKGELVWNLASKQDSPVWFYHYVQSFHPQESVTGKEAHQLAQDFARQAWPDSEVLIATHTDAQHIETSSYIVRCTL